MGKRRTAKTGDKALYKSRPNVSDDTAANNSDDDAMFNAVDRFHNRQDFLKLDAGGSTSESEEDDGISGREAVLDLGGGESSSSSEDDDDSVDQHSAEKHAKESSSSTDDDDSSDDDEMAEMEHTDVRDWGSKRSSYYHGDTADLEIGQDEEDAFLEEEAAKEVQAARYEQMDEEDFVMSDDEEEKSTTKVRSEKKTIDIRGTRDLSKLSKADRRRLLQSHHPELLPLVSHFKDAIEDWNGKTKVVANTVLNGDKDTIEAIGATPAGIQYLVSKALLQSSTALNVAMYLLLKSEQRAGDAETEADLWDVGGDTASAMIDSHPVISRLQHLNKMAQKLEDRVENKVEALSEQMDNLVKANDLMNADEDDLGSLENDDESEASDVEGGPAKTHSATEEANNATSKVSTTYSSDEGSQEDIAASAMNDARFGLRSQELGTNQRTGKRRARRAMPVDFGDEEDTYLATKATQSLASTINSIEQRSAVRLQKKSPRTETLDEQGNENDGLLRGLEMMESELGRLESDDDPEGNAEFDEELNDDLDEDEFYKNVKERSRAKKQRKADIYAVAPKFPGMDKEIQGERAISKTILKNRGLVAHKSKLNRNPRVKKREQYRKALVRRKGHVREVRTDEGHKYGGEGTGIKSGLSRSRKLG